MLLTQYLLESLNCRLQHWAKICGKLSSNDLFIDSIAHMFERNSSNCETGTTLCQLENIEERRLFIKGSLCAAESGQLHEYIDSCFDFIESSMPWKKIFAVMKAKTTKKNISNRELHRSSDIEQEIYEAICPKEGQALHESLVYNECISMTGLIEHQCGAYVAKKFFRLHYKHYCKKEIDPPVRGFRYIWLPPHKSSKSRNIPNSLRLLIVVTAALKFL